MEQSPQYVIEMLHITKEFPGIKANDDITLQLRKGEIHALLGENGAGKSTLMSVLFGLYQPEQGTIRKNGQEVKINNPNDANALGIGMVHQHFKLIDVFTVLDNIILGAEDTKMGFLQKKAARQKVQDLSQRYGLRVDLDARIEDITVGMQQRVEILKMLYRDNEILIFDEPTAVLTPQEIDELMEIMRSLTKEGKSILFISHKLNEIMAVADRVTVLRKGRYVGTVNTCDTNKQELSNMMVGRPVQLQVVKEPAQPKDPVLRVRHMCVASHQHKRDAVHDVSLEVRAGEIVCIAGIDGNGQTEFVQGLTGLDKITGGTVELCGKNITHASIRHRGENMSHIPEDRHKHGLILDFTLEQNMVLQRYLEPQFQTAGFIKNAAVREYAQRLIDQYDVRSGQGPVTIVRSMSGGNQQKAIIAREIDKDPKLLVAVQPTRGLDVGAIEYIHRQLVAQRDGAGNGLRKLRCGGGLAVACEGDHIGELAFGCHLAQLCLERVEYHGSCVVRLMAGALGVEAVFAVNAVERADFAAGRHHVDAERETKATAANGPKDGAGIQKRRHRHMLLKTIVPKHSIGSKARCGLLLYKFRFFTSLVMPCHEKPRVGYS